MADIAQLGIEIDTRKLKSGEKDLASFASSASSAERAVSRATAVITSMIAVLSVQKIISAADSFSMLEARISRFTDSASETASVMSKLTQYANASGSAMRDTASVFVQLSSSAQDLGKSQDQVLEFTRLITEIGYYGGSSSDELSNALRQMSQSFAGGIVRAEEFNSVIENTPEIARTIASGMGISMGQLRQEMLAGKLTAEAVFDAILSQGGNVDALFAKMPRTVSAAMQTMENELTTLVGRLNQSEGATGGLSSGIDALSDVIRSASEHTEAIVTVTEALAAVYAAKLVGSIGNAVSAKIKDVAATTAQTKAIATETEAVAVAAAAQARRAAANVSVAESAVTAAGMDLALAKAATAAGTAEMSLAQTEINSAKTTIALLESERALEAQRLKAQITDQGRIATYTRMAEIERAMQVTKASLSKAEIAYSESVAAATAKETAAKEALIIAESQLRNAKLAKTEATIAETAAQNIASASARAATASMTALKGVMGFLGGPAGVAMLAAAAIYYFYQKSQEATQQALDFADSVDTTTQALRNMTPVAAAAANAKLIIALQEQEESAADLRDELQALEDKYRSGTSASGNYQLSQSQLADLQNQIAIKAGEVEEAENKVSQTRSKQHAITALLNGTLRENYVEQQNNNNVTGIAVGIQNQLNAALGIGNARLATRTEYVTNLSGKSSISDAVKGEVAAINAEAAALSITDLRAREAALTRLEYAKDTKKTADEVNLLVDAHMKVWDQEQKNAASEKLLASATKSAASAAKQHAEEVKRQKQSITDLNQQLEVAKVEVASGGRAAVELTAKYEAQRQGLGNLTDSYVQAKLALYDFQQLQNTNTQFDQYLDNQTASLLKLKQQAQTQLTGPKQQIVVSGIDKKLQEQTFANLPTIDGGAQTNEQNQIAQLQTQTTAMNDAYNQRIADYQRFRASEVENAAYYDSQIQALEDKKAANNKAAQEAMMNLQLQAGESMATSAADSLRKMVGEQSAAYQTMFAVQKAFSIQRAILAIKTGIASAWEAGWPNGAIYAAGVVAATGSLVSDIMSVASPSFDGGGYTGNGSRSGGLDGKGGFWAMMHPQETVIDHTKSSGSISSGSSSGGNVTVNVSLQETSDASKQGTTEQSTSDDGSVQINVFVADIRSEGSMAQVLERTYGLTRMGA